MEDSYVRRRIVYRNDTHVSKLYQNAMAIYGAPQTSDSNIFDGLETKMSENLAKNIFKQRKTR